MFQVGAMMVEHFVVSNNHQLHMARERDETFTPVMGGVCF